MIHQYGNFTKNQVFNYVKKIHSMIHWMLIYKDPCFGEKYSHVSFDIYFDSVMSQISGFGYLIGNPPVIVNILSTLESAYLESKKETYDYKKFRKLILDAQTLVDRIGD